MWAYHELRGRADRLGRQAYRDGSSQRHKGQGSEGMGMDMGMRGWA